MLYTIARWQDRSYRASRELCSNYLSTNNYRPQIRFVFVVFFVHNSVLVL